MSESQQETTTQNDTSTGEYETTEYETVTDNDDKTIDSVKDESVASSQPASSVSSFFEANKAPESEYEAKIRLAKELEEKKKKREAKLGIDNNRGPQFEFKENNAPMAPEHYTVEVKRRQWDGELKKFREKQRKLLKSIRLTSKRKAAALHERIFFTIRWSNPELPSIFRKIMLEYCEHLLGPFPERKYEKINVIQAWYSKFSHTAEGKVVDEIKELCERLRVLVLKRDEKTVKSIVKLEEKTELMTIKKEGDVRWHMETMHCARDDYWTIWYLCRRNLKLELLRMLETFKDVDVKDPDFGWTSLHYACKENHWEIFSILLQHGASESAVIEEDGRQPLHLAAQYASKEMCLELLAVGADFYAKDKYGSTPLDLAVQSKNYPVITVLQNWTQLLPPEEDDDVVIEDVSHVPEEFLSTPYEVLMTMSPPLRVITTRLEGTDVNATHSMDSGMDIAVEIRLCERRCNMCLDEGFDFEAMKSRKRRWTVAKNGYIKQLTDQENVNESETRVQAENKVQSRDDKLYTENEIGDDKSTNDNSKTVTKKASTAKLSSSLLFTICSDLFESLIREKAYSDADKIMSEGLAVIKMDDTTKVSLLMRQAQLLLFLSDKMSSDAKQPIFIPPHAGSNSFVKVKVKPDADESFVVGEEFNHTTSYASLNVSDDGSNSCAHKPNSHSFTVQPQAKASYQDGSILINPSASAPLLRENFDGKVDDTIHAVPNNVNETVPSNLQAYSVNASPYDIILMRAESNANEALDILKQSYDFNFIEPVSLSPLLELAAEIADRQGRFGDALHFMEHAAIVKERTLGQAHSETVRLFIESLRLLLRKQMMLAAQRKAKRDEITRQEDDILNESLTSKLMNEKRINKIRDARTKEATAEDKKRFSEVGLQATDVSRRLDRLSAENEEEALKLSRKCYNLVSLTELIVQGEVKPNDVLPDNGESLSLRALNSKVIPAQILHALERSAFDESSLNKI